MIFFISKYIGVNLFSFILKKYKKDIKSVVVEKNDTSSLKFLKKYLPPSKIIVWSEKNKLKNIKKLKKLKPNKFFLLWWKFILDTKFLEIPKYETINIHPSYLPYFKGRDPCFWSLLKGGPFGVSIHSVISKIDSGNILYRKKIKKIDFTIDSKKLYEISIREVISLFKDKYQFLRKNKISQGLPNKIVGKISKRKDMLAETIIDLKKTYKAEYILNLLRAKTFPPNDGVIFKDIKKKYSININIKLIKNKKN